MYKFKNGELLLLCDFVCVHTSIIWIHRHDHKSLLADLVWGDGCERSCPYWSRQRHRRRPTVTSERLDGRAECHRFCRCHRRRMNPSVIGELRSKGNINAMSISQSTKRCTDYGAALGESDMWRPHDLRTVVAMAAAVTGIARCGG